MKNKKFTYRKTRNAVLIAMIASLVIIFVSSALPKGSAGQELMACAGIVVFFAALAVVLIGFRCPVCGCGFFKSALFIAKCPACGFEFSDFVLGEKIEKPEWSRRNDSGEHIHKHD